MPALYNKLYTFLNRYRKYIPIIIDMCIAVFSYFIPFAISGIHYLKFEIFKETLYLYVSIYILTFIAIKSYKNMWRYTGIVDLYRSLCAALLSNVLFCVITLLINLYIPYYVFLIATAVSIACTVSVRIIYRAILIIGRKSNNKTHDNQNSTNVMIVGAGQATSMMLEEIRNNNPNNYLVKCIVDDDKTKIGRDIKSVPIVSSTEKIIEMTKKYNIQEIILSIPSLDVENKKRILEICANTQCKLRILPEIYSLIAQEGYNDLVNKIRDVEVEDLLGREPIVLDCQLTKEYIHNKVVMVTGGGGSIGSELCRQIASYFPKNLIILDIYENNAYNIQQELTRNYGELLNMEIEIASVRDKNKLEQIFASKNIDIVYHAAAHKHVPLMEKNPEEAVKNNIIGTYNTVMMADKYKVSKFVLISTDKAVNPTNVMGATKRICEMIVQAYDKKSKTDFVAVRFGNVLGSNGSVIPLFVEQIKAGGPVTVTHEEITRYFMTIPEAVQLVMRASAIAKGGEIFVLDMGEPVKIKDLAYNIIRLSGLVPNKDIEITYTGLRPGEKLYEELLITEDLGQTKTDIEKIFVEKPLEINVNALFENIKILEKAAFNMDLDIELKVIEALVPTYIRTPNGYNNFRW
ncbi:MAG: nucleoside-diphosphate sugar epimerase/dehydratase [Tissierellia bacterium]|nr:nucleoside-diphosphate sugar epimerase/dehydratase [Tissierellia bacterium]